MKLEFFTFLASAVALVNGAKTQHLRAGSKLHGANRFLQDSATCEFKANEVSMKWNQHQATAEAQGCNLASILSRTEFETVKKLVQGRDSPSSISRALHIFVGGRVRDGGTPGKPGAENWEWVDGSPWSYENWLPGEPNNSNGREKHLALRLAGGRRKWNDKNGNLSYPAVYKCCVMEPEMEPVPTSSPTMNLGLPADPTSSPTGLPANPTLAPADAVMESVPTSSPTGLPANPTLAPAVAVMEPTGSPTVLPADPTLAPVVAVMEPVPTSSPTVLPADPTLAPADAMMEPVPTSSPTVNLGLPEDPALAPVVTPTDESTSCTFEANEESMSWNQHQATAEAQDCNLASILTMNEFDTVKELVQDSNSPPALSEALHIYIGGRVREGGRPGRPGAAHWEWVDGSPWGYENWLPDEPNNSNEKELHLALRLAGGRRQWNDQDGSLAYPAVYKCCVSSPSKNPTLAPVVSTISPVATPALPSDTHVPSGLLSGFPSNLPSLAPTSAPTRKVALPVVLTPVPVAPSSSPSDTMSSAPSTSRSDQPSTVPSAVPSDVASGVPSDVPSVVPTSAPTRKLELPVVLTPAPVAPSASPSDTMSSAPSTRPTDRPSRVPSAAPSDVPSDAPSNVPSVVPTSAPTRKLALPVVLTPAPVAPSSSPSDTTSSAPSIRRSDQPSTVPSAAPSDVPSDAPSNVPSLAPTSAPTRKFALPVVLTPVPVAPSSSPSDMRSSAPSTNRSDQPSTVPSAAPSDVPSDVPSDAPSSVPTISIGLPAAPTATPTNTPVDAPSSVPSVAPTRIPLPAAQKTPFPTSPRTGVPTKMPSSVPSDAPSDVPSSVPSDAPSDVPSLVSSDAPSDVPSSFPSALPTAVIGLPKAPTSAPICHFLLSDVFLNWEEHKSTAERLKNCELASLANQAEHDRVIALIESSPPSITNAHAIFLGGKLREGGQAGENGAENWEWIDGTEWLYENWHADEPNNEFGNEDLDVETVLTIFNLGGVLLWNDEDPAETGPAIYKCCV